MRVLMKVTTKNDRLSVRSGPGKNYNINGSLGLGDETIVVDVSDNGDGVWYQLEDGSGWACGRAASAGYDYLTILQDLENLDPLDPAPDTSSEEGVEEQPEEQPEQIDYAAILSEINNANDISQDNTMTYAFGVGGEQSEAISDLEELDRMQKLYATNLDNYEKTNKYDDPKFIQNEYGYPINVGQEPNRIKIYNYATDYTPLENNLRKIRSNINQERGDSRDLNWDLFRRFNRFKIAFPDQHLSKTFAYVFITRPDLNLLNDDSSWLHSQVQNDPSFYYLFRNNSNILQALTKNYNNQDHDFHPFLSNEASSFELSDEFIKTVEVGETYTGYKIVYGKNNIDSKTAGTFVINYTDDAEFTIYKTHKAWIDYISKVYRGELKSKDIYIQSKILDYACSAYYILCGPDGKTILFWSKYFGVFPTNAPSSTSSWSKGNLLKIPEYAINYSYAFKEDFNPLTLAEFNKLSRGSFVYKNIYEPSSLSTGKSFSGAPFIDTHTSVGPEYDFKLRFRE